MAKLENGFDTQDAGEGAAQVHSIWESIELEDDQRELAFFTSKDKRWTRARLNEQGVSRMAEIAGDHSTDWQGLGVSILHRLAIETLLGGKDLPKPKYVHLIDEVVDALEAAPHRPQHCQRAMRVSGSVRHCRPGWCRSPLPA